MPPPFPRLREQEGKLHEIAGYRLEKETSTGDEFMKIFNGTSKTAGDAEE